MDWKVLGSTLALLFVAELGDKTQLAVISMVCKSGKPVPVFVGAVVALALVTLLGVLGGQLLMQWISPETLRRVASVAFVVMGVLMWFEVL
ncbi:MAG: TMEM165/GDT1 family protein [Chloroflexi bacterium]|nr:TMEM165/GDT1 family protein [Chloroflexota bacterium]